MSLDSTAWESNVRDSVKKYFVDNLKVGEGYPVSFDTLLNTPNVQGVEVDRWIVVIFGPLTLANISEMTLEIYCCSRRDPEGFKLTKMRDKLIQYLTDNTHIDGRRRIPFYKSNEDADLWELLGALLVDVETDSGNIIAPDGTKIKIIPVTLRWGAKV